MNAKEIVKTFITALQSGAIDMAAQYMTNDFKLVGWLPQVPVEFVLNDGKVAEMKMQAVPGGGMQGLLQQLGEIAIAPRIQPINQLGNTEASQETEVRIHSPAFGPATEPVNEYPE